MKKNNSSYKTSLSRLSATGILVSIGIVFGDIGTSPLYVMKAIVSANPNYDADYILGTISCVIWTLTLQTSVKYVLLALRADNNGEGGILALFSLLRRLPHHWLFIVAAIGAAALIADGVITPAITVTSAIEGLKIIMPDIEVLPIVLIVIILIFVMQQAGTGRIGRCFGPFMLIWFMMLGVSGIINFIAWPSVLKAFNPWYAVKLLISSPSWFLIMGAVFLCTTGAEALYSDLGHCGRKNITVSWFFVKLMLICNYLGQGAWLIVNKYDSANIVNPFFAILPHDFMWVGIAMSTGAAVIASQALLSGSFTIFSEAINMDFWPRMRIKYPSAEKGQLYIPSINWTLLAGCMLTVLIFRDSGHMEAAYGLAITVAMLMTTVLLTMWLRSRGVNIVLCSAFAIFFILLESLFFTANLFKFVHGGWFTVLLAGIVAAVMIIWFKATKLRSSFIEFKDKGCSHNIISEIKADKDIPKYTSNLIYFSRSQKNDVIESKIIYSIVNKRPKRADHYWFIHLEYVDNPDMLEYSADIAVPNTIYDITMRFGFRVEPKVSVYLRQIVEDLVASGELDLTSSYPSLRREGIPGDFRFIIIHRIFSPTSNCRRRDAIMMRLHQWLRHIGISDQCAMGLDTSVVTCETVPLIINTTPGRRIVRTNNQT